MKNLYIVTPFCIEKKTEEDFEKEAKIKSIIHNREITVEQIKTKFADKSSNYKISYNDSSYFDNIEDALDFLKNDYAGVYEYTFNMACILETAMGSAYPTNYSTDFKLLKYNEKIKGYDENYEISEEVLEAIKFYFNYNDEMAQEYKKQQNS